MINNYHINVTHVGRVQGADVGYTSDSTHMYRGALYVTLHLDDVSLSPCDLCCSLSYIRLHIGDLC
jgi:hypothetical protein